jgi:hypothetical protein
MTVMGAYLLCWKILWPIGRILRARVRSLASKRLRQWEKSA